MDFSSITPSYPAGDSDRARTVAAVAAVEKEQMFEKVVTPSDVGKLNRLVIPKQHAERYFPLDAAAAASGGKGLVLSFEDRAGKPWRFRYSYWNSSQSYVMTKGWSRFVKEKRLRAGDTVFFCRGLGEASRGRLFIDFRHRRHDATGSSLQASPRLPLPSVPLGPWRDYSDVNKHFLFLRPQVPAAVVLRTVPVRVAASAVEASRSKRVRLFGVNLDCPDTKDDDKDDAGSIAASALLQLPSPSTSSSSGRGRCFLDLGL